MKMAAEINGQWQSQWREAGVAEEMADISEKKISKRLMEEEMKCGRGDCGYERRMRG